METKVAVVITRRPTDYHASIKGYPSISGYGSNPNEAVGDLVTAHLGRFCIAWVEYPPQVVFYK